MIAKLTRRMLAAQTLSALTVSVCLLIDNMMIGRFLGVGALAADGLANPVLLALMAVGSLLSTGVQVACSKSLGKGSKEETDFSYSTAVMTALVFSAVFMALVISLRVPLSRLLGANEEKLLKDTGDYIAGFAIGAPATMGALILIPFLQIAGQSSLLIVAVLSMTITDVAFDLLNVFVLKWEMFGMGLASALSYYVAIAIAATYFLSKRCVFSFSFPGVKLRKLKEFLTGGAPTIFGLASSVLLVFIMNMILLDTGGDMMVACFAVLSTIGNASNCISTGTNGVALTLSGIFYTEEDRTCLRSMFKTIMRSAFAMGAGVMTLLLIFAPALVSLFIPEEGAQQDAVVFALRIYSLELIPCCVNNAFKGSYQGTQHIRLMEVLSVMQGVVLPVAAALAFRGISGGAGIWWYYPVGEALTLLGILGWVWLQKHAITLRTDDLLLLGSDFGVPPEDLLERNIKTIQDVMDTSRAASEFCHSHGGDGLLGSHLALCVEEMGANIINYGFEAGRGNNCSIRLQRKEGRWTLRFRDDCKAFDPVTHVSEHTTSKGMGIRIAMRVADEARYTYSMNLNNLVMVFNENKPAPKQRKGWRRSQNRHRSWAERRRFFRGWKR
ncbi:MAG: ATP-binding protein [Clostridiales bacterium]|nr:ATP-binding protein [Clostridiales bacterium]